MSGDPADDGGLFITRQAIDLVLAHLDEQVITPLQVCAVLAVLYRLDALDTEWLGELTEVLRISVGRPGHPSSTWRNVPNEPC